MQLPEPLPPLAPLWDRVVRARTLPPDLDVHTLYTAIKDRLTHPEWEIRLHALRVLADILPLSNNALPFPFDQVIGNLGHSSPNVRKAALDALKVYCSHCDEPEYAARAILDKCEPHNLRPYSANQNKKVNVITGLLLSLPSVMGILKRRYSRLDLITAFKTVGDKLLDVAHRDAALRSLIKLRRVTGPRDYIFYFSQLDTRIQNKFRLLCDFYDEDSMDVYYSTKSFKSDKNSDDSQLVSTNYMSNSYLSPIRITTDSSSDSSVQRSQCYSNNVGKVIIETEIKFDSDTAITMTVLEGHETETDSEKNVISEDDSSDRNMLKYSDYDSEDADLVVKKVRFGGESIKIRTPDSENQTSEDDTRTINNNDINKQHTEQKTIPLRKDDDIEKSNQIKSQKVTKPNEMQKHKKSNIPLPIIPIKTKPIAKPFTKNNTIGPKSKSLNELYDYFRSKNNYRFKEESNFALTLAEVRSPDKVPSPVEPHRAVEVLHNLQRSPTVSPKRRKTIVQIECDDILVNLVKLIPSDTIADVSSELTDSLQRNYEWEQYGIVPKNVVEQLHNQENWISVVKAANQIHSALSESHNVTKIEPAVISLIQHMWTLGDKVPASRAPTEGVVCTLFRNSSTEAARKMLPLLVSRLVRDPPPAALTHALLQRLAIHQIVDMIFDANINLTEDAEAGQLRAALCLARAAGPAAVLSAVRRKLIGTSQADTFCQQLRNTLSDPAHNKHQGHIPRSSQLPLPIRRRARSTPPVAAPASMKIRSLPDSAPISGWEKSRMTHDYFKIPNTATINVRDSSAATTCGDGEEQKDGDEALEQDPHDTPEYESPPDELDTPPGTRSPSLLIENYSIKSISGSIKSVAVSTQDQQNEEPDCANNTASTPISHKSGTASPKTHSRPQSRRSSPSPVRIKSTVTSPLKSRSNTPAHSEVYEEPSPNKRDVRLALSECILPSRHDDWEVIVNALIEIDRLASDTCARAPTTSWRTVVRSVTSHVRSLRSRVARIACSTLGSLFANRARHLDPELEEATSALLERCADVNRFLRADAVEALSRIACSGHLARAAVALSRRGASHRAGPIRAAAAHALTKLVQHHGANNVLDLPQEPRTVLLRAAGEMLADAIPETRKNARSLCNALSDDNRFKQMLKDAMSLTRYLAVEKYVEKLNR